MATIHFILQGKGCVGKSLIAALLAQYLQGRNLEVHCVDTDPINATLTGYEALDAVTLDIMSGDDIDPRRFDKLIDAILELPADVHVVVDNGASSFVPLGSYLLENQALEVLEKHGHSAMLHTVVTGGQAILDTLSGLKSLVSHFPATPIVVWLNRYFGDITLDGKRFEEFKIYAECASNFHAVISLPHRKQSTFGRDLEELFARRQTFTEAVNTELPIMVRQRLTSFWRDAVAEMDQARLCRGSAMSEQNQLKGDTPSAVPDGIGLDLESVRTLLAQKHAAVVDPDDPVLMLVTLQNAILAEYEKLLDRHNKALTVMLAEKTDGYVSGVLSATKGLAKDFSAASVENTRTILQGHVSALAAFRQNLIWLAAIVIISALVNVAVFALQARG